MENEEPKNEKPKTETELAQEFVAKYKQLCDEHGFQISVKPDFKARDDGTWSVILQSSVGRIKRGDK